jgi:hypothetical protein
MSSLTGFFRENDLFFYRHSGGVLKAASRRHCEEERRSNPVITSLFRIASFLAMTNRGFRDTPHNPEIMRSSVRVFISEEQTKGTDEGDKSNSVVYGRCAQRPIKSGARFRRALHLSGIASVGRCTQRPYTESAIMRPSSVGGMTKQSGYYQLFPDCFTSFAMTNRGFQDIPMQSIRLLSIIFRLIRFVRNYMLSFFHSATEYNVKIIV